MKKKSKSPLSRIATAGKKTVAIRFPSHEVAKRLLKIINKPLAAPSANISTKLSSTCAKDVFDEFGKKIKIILDGGKCKIGIESTIIDLTGKPSILRPGKITKEKIEKWGKYTIGSGLKIISEEEARNLNPKYFFVMPYGSKIRDRKSVV